MKAVVMAGGEGSRLRPLTSRRPKPLAPIANKPVMEHIVDLLRKHGVTEIVATLHYLADEIESYFGDGSAFGVALSYVVEDTPLGTAGAVKLAEHLLRDEPFLVISGDALTDLDLSALVADHRRTGATATITLQRVPNPLEFGVVITDEQRRITRFLEKPSWGEIFSDTINTGIYVLDPSVFDYMERGKNYDFSRDLFPRMLHENRLVQGFITEDYWTDIGTLQQYQQANYDALNGRARVVIPGAEIAPGVWQGEDCNVHPEARLVAPVVLGKNVVVEAGATVGAGVGARRLGGGGEARAAGSHDRVERHLLRRILPLTGCTLADRNIVKERVVIGEGAVIGSNCIIGSGAVIRPNIKLWPDKNVRRDRLDVADLRHQVAGLAVRRRRRQRARQRRDHARVYDEARSGVRLVLETRSNSDDQSRRAPGGAHHESLRHLGFAFGRHQRRGPARDPDPPGALYHADGWRRRRAHARRSERPKRAPDRATRQERHQRRQGDRTKDRKPLLSRRFPANGDGRRGHLAFPARSLEIYTSEFLAALKPKALPKAGFKVVVDYGYGNASIVLPRILSNLGVDIVALDAYYDELKARTFRLDRERYLEQLRTVTLTLGADLGVLVDHDGESYALIDDQGRVVAGNRLLALMTLLVGRKKPGARIAIPITTPNAIERLAASVGASVTRTRSDRRSMMALADAQRETLDYGSGVNQEPIFPEFQPAFDALYAIVKLMELLAAEGRKLHELNDLLPHWFFRHRAIQCPWERKGEVMRTIVDENQGRDVEMFDGVRVRLDGESWFLVLPDARIPRSTCTPKARPAKTPTV